MQFFFLPLWLSLTLPLTYLPSAMANFFAPSMADTPALGPELEPWRPDTKFETYGQGIDTTPFLVASQNGSAPSFDLQETTLNFLSSQLQIGKESLVYKHGYEDDISKHAFVSQAIDGIQFLNADAHVTYNRFEKVVALSSSIVSINQASIASSSPSIPLELAIQNAESALQGTYNQHPIQTGYLATLTNSTSSNPSSSPGTSIPQTNAAIPDNSKAGVETNPGNVLIVNEEQGIGATLVYAIQVQNDSATTWFEAYVDAHLGDLVGATNFVSN